MRAANVAFAHFTLANLLSFRLGECILLCQFVQADQQCGPEYMPPDCMEVGHKLLDTKFKTYYHKEVTKLFEELGLYSIFVYGDGATIKTMPFINVLSWPAP